MKTYIITSKTVGSLILRRFVIIVGNVNKISVSKHIKALFKSPLKSYKTKHKITKLLKTKYAIIARLLECLKFSLKDSALFDFLIFFI